MSSCSGQTFLRINCLTLELFARSLAVPVGNATHDAVLRVLHSRR
jgi:hypothetical protein